MKNNCDLILVAGGSGERFSAPSSERIALSEIVPKQFEVVHGKSVYLWSLETFFSWEHAGKAIVVVPERWSSEISEQVSKLSLGDRLSRIQVVTGGSSRQISASLGMTALQSSTENSWVMVHDAARPCLTHSLLDRLWAARDASFENQEFAGVIPGLPLNDTLKRVKDFVVQETLPREQLFSVQTPQLFKTAILAEAYGDGGTFTDDSALLENRGFKIVVVPGEYDNLKITLREDLHLVSNWLRVRHP